MFECSVCGVRDGAVIVGDATNGVCVLGGINRGDLHIGGCGACIGGALVVRKLYILIIRVL